MSSVKRSRLANKECSMARAMEVVGDRWSILILREAYYGVKRFDEFEYYIGIAPNILSTRLKKFIDAGVMTRMPLIVRRPARRLTFHDESANSARLVSTRIRFARYSAEA